MCSSGNRPTAVTVIGWLFVFVAVLMILSAVMGLLSFIATNPTGTGSRSLPNPAVSFVFNHFRLIASMEIVLGLVVSLIAANFLRLRSWARTAIEGLCWLALFFVAALVVLQTWPWNNVAGGKGVPQVFSLIRVLMGAFTIIAWGVPVIVIIAVLRKPATKRAFKEK